MIQFTKNVHDTAIDIIRDKCALNNEAMHDEQTDKFMRFYNDDDCVVASFLIPQCTFAHFICKDYEIIGIKFVDAATYLKNMQESDPEWAKQFTDFNLRFVQSMQKELTNALKCITV